MPHNEPTSGLLAAVGCSSTSCCGAPKEYRTSVLCLSCQGRTDADNEQCVSSLAVHLSAAAELHVGFKTEGRWQRSLMVKSWRGKFPSASVIYSTLFQANSDQKVDPIEDVFFPSSTWSRDGLMRASEVCGRTAPIEHTMQRSYNGKIHRKS